MIYFGDYVNCGVSCGNTDTLTYPGNLVQELGLNTTYFWWSDEIVFGPGTSTDTMTATPTFGLVGYGMQLLLHP